MHSQSILERYQNSQILKERLEERKQQELNKDSPAGSSSLAGTQNFDYSYFSFNSLYKNKSTTMANKLIFSVVPQADSQQGTVGVSRVPSQVVQMQISPILLSRKFNTPISRQEDLYYGKLFVLITEFNNQAYSNHNGFKFHFGFDVSQDPNDVTQTIAKPFKDTVTFPNAVRFDSTLSFELYTYRAYDLEEDTYQCFCDYSGAFLRFRKTDGSDHGLSNLDIIYLENFSVPGIYDEKNKTTETFRDNQYRISVVDTQNFEIPIAVDPLIAANINRPADSSLGVYKPGMTFNCTAGNPSVVNSTIPHGLANGNTVQVTYVSSSLLSGVIGTWPVTVTSPTQFTIPFDSSAIVGTFQVVIASLPISPDRINAILVRIVTKKISFDMRVASKSGSADNAVILTAV